MSTTWQTVRVFISSTFRDMQAERDHLVRFVFPKLRQELLQRHIHLVDVDLRWGVTSEQDALAVCREVVDECQPRFLCMLGGRYGWVPPGKTQSITAAEVHYGVLDRPLKSHGFAYFYFRDPSTTAAMAEVAPGEFREPDGSPGAVALAELKTAIVKAGFQPFTYRAEMWDDPSRRLIGLKEFGDRVSADLRQSINQEFGPTTEDKPDEFTEEKAAMEAFIEERVQRFVLGSRQPVWEELRQHALSTGGNGYLCLTGAAGSGKSALLGKFFQDYRAAHPPDLVIPHFVGASPGSADVRRTLRRLCHELVAGAGLTAEIPEEPEKLRVAFAEILERSSARKRVVILLDAVNQFDSTSQLGGWSWLPQELPPTARIILSTLAEPATQGEPAAGPTPIPASSPIEGENGGGTMSSPVIEALGHRQTPPKALRLGPLTQDDAEAIIRESLHRYRKSMTDDQRASLLAKADAGTPLYLLVALEELRTLGTYEEITMRIRQLPSDTPALFTWILKRLEDDDGFRDASGRKIGRELVTGLVSLLGVSRHGLSQQELVDLLSPGDPHGNVAALTQLLRPYLMQRGELLDFYHGQLRQAAATAYLPSQCQRAAAHDRLAARFHEKADPERNQGWEAEGPRPLLELVFHLTGAQRIDDYCQVLCDLRFVEARCRSGQVFELIADYRLAQKNLPEAQAELREERAREERVQRWAADIVAYSRQWSDRRHRLAGGEMLSELEPALPEVIASAAPWSDDRIAEVNRRISDHPARLDRVRAFAEFVASEVYALLGHGGRLGFVAQHAFNAAPAGPVHHAAAQLCSSPGPALLLRRWPANTAYNPRPALRQTLEGHTGAVYSVAVTSDSRLAVSGASLDERLAVWDLESGVCRLRLAGHREGVHCLSLTLDGQYAVSGSSDRTIRVWNLENGLCLDTFAGHGKWVRSVSVTPDGRRVVSASGDKTVRVWDSLATCTVARILEGHAGAVYGVTVTADGRRAISGSADQTLRVWDLDQGECVHVLAGHSGAVHSVSVAADGRRAVSGSGDKTVRVWDLKDRKCLRILEGHHREVYSVRITPDGRHAISGGADRALRVWDLDTGECLRVLDGHSDAVHSVGVAADGRCAVSGGGDKTVRVWDVEGRVCARPIEAHRLAVNSLSVTPDGRRVVSGSSDKTLRLWDLESGACLALLEGHREWITSVVVTPEGRRAVSASGDHSLRVWDLDSRACLRTLDGHADSVDSVTVTPDGRRIVSGSSDNTVRVWNLECGTCEHVLAGHRFGIRCVGVTPDSACVLSGSVDQTVRVWDVKTGACLRTLEGHSWGVSSVCVTPDGRHAVTGGQDKTLRVWDWQTGACLRTFGGHSEGIQSLCVMPDGRHTVSASGDGTVRLWDLENGRCLGLVTGSGLGNAVAHSSALGLVVVGTETGNVIPFHLTGLAAARPIPLRG